jgi:hypothetical protein
MGYDWQVSSPREPPRPLGQHASSMPPSPPMQSPLPIWSPSSYLSATRCSAVCAVANPRSARGVCSVRGMCISPPSFLPPHASLSRSLPLLPPRARTPYLPYISLTSLRPSLLLLTQRFGSRVPAEPLHVSPLLTRVRTTARRARRTMLARSRSCLPLTLTLASSGPNPTLARLNPNPNPASRPDCNPNFTLSLIYNPNPTPNPITNPNQVKIVHYTCGPKPWGYPRARLQRCAANSGHCTGMAPCLADWTMRWYVARDEVCRAWQTAVRLPPPDGCT